MNGMARLRVTGNSSESMFKKKLKNKFKQPRRELKNKSDSGSNSSGAREKANAREGLSLGMIDPLKAAQLLHHDASPSILDAKMLLWQISGRGNFNGANDPEKLHQILESDTVSEAEKQASSASPD